MAQSGAFGGVRSVGRRRAIVTRRRRGRARTRFILALFCLYAPYSWLVLMDGPWNAYRWYWIRMWPLLPGLLVHAIPSVHRQPDGVGFLAMAAAASLIFAVTVLLARRGGRTATVASV